MDAMSLLHADHQRVLSLLDQFEREGEDGLPVAADGPRVRAQRATELIIAESRHEIVEEQYFWPAVRRALPDGEQLAVRAIEQENAAKEALNTLEHTDPGDIEFSHLLGQISEDVRVHIQYEEQEVWPRLRAALTPSELDELGEEIRAAKDGAPTRPHPHTPSSGAVHRGAGPLAAAVDRVRDAATGRGEHGNTDH